MQQKGQSLPPFLLDSLANHMFVIPSDDWVPADGIVGILEMWLSPK